MQQCRLIAAISHLSDVGCGKSGALIIRLNDAILFDTGSDIIKVNARNTFDKLVVVLKEVPNSIKLEGLTCNKLIKILKLPSNWNLSIAGAIKIVVKKHDFDLKRLLIAGYGCCLPVSCNLTKKLI
jgi:chemotaxis protein MotB